MLLIDAIGVKVSGSQVTDGHVDIAMSASIQGQIDVPGLRLALTATSPQRSQPALNLCADGSLDQSETPHEQHVNHRGLDCVLLDLVMPDLEIVAKLGEGDEFVVKNRSTGGIPGHELNKRLG